MLAGATMELEGYETFFTYSNWLDRKHANCRSLVVKLLGSEDLLEWHLGTL